MRKHAKYRIIMRSDLYISRGFSRKMMENPNCAYFRKNFFCRKNENIMQTVRDIKTLDKNLCFALTEKIREKELKRTKKLR